MKYILLLFIICSSFVGFSQIKVNDKEYSIDECVRIAQEEYDKKNIREATKYINAAAFYKWEEKDYKTAIELHKKSIELNGQINNYSGIAGLESNLGLIYADMGNYDSSLVYMMKNLKAREKENEKERIVNAKINVSVVLNRLKRYDESISQLEQALKLASDVNNRDLIRTCYTSLAETYDLKGDRKNATKYFEFYKAYVDNAQKDKEIKLQEALDKVQKDIGLTQTEKEEREVQLKLKEKELLQKKAQLSQFDSAYKELAERATKTELQVQVLEKEEALNKMKREEAEKSLKQQRQLNIMTIVILIIAIILLINIGSSLIKDRRVNRLLKERNEIISKQKLRLEEENNVRTKLLSILSHDLRTPMSGVHLLLQLMRSKSLPQETIDKQMVKLDESLDITFQMLENMLYWAKNQVTGLTTKLENIDLAVITVENIKLSGAHIYDKQIEIENELYDADAFADRELIRIVIRNLISNAVKFTPQNGKITITVEKHDKSIAWSITDTGKGIPEEMREKIFSNEIKSSKGTDSENGSGLGLIICKQFVEMCNGSISYKSIVGEGATFTIVLPKGQ